MQKKSGLLFKVKTLAFYGFLMALAGCTTEAEIVLPMAPPKLVVSSFISPEAPRVEVSVSKSAPLTSPDNNGRLKSVTDATVWLSDGTDSVQLQYNAIDLYTSGVLAIKPGRQYTLRVTAPGGFAVHATCTVPAKINQTLTGRIDSTVIGPQTNEGNYALELRWQDLPGSGDYYRAEGITEIFENTSPGTMLRSSSLSFIDEPHVKDLDADGRTWNITSDIIGTYREMRRNGNLKRVRGILYTTDRAYYEYHRTLYQYQLSNSFSDPIKIYSNVKGGLGIFGAYRLYAIDIPVR